MTTGDRQVFPDRRPPSAVAGMDWNTEHVRDSPAFAPLRVHGHAVFERAAPGLDDLQGLLDRRDPPVRVAGGRPLRVVGQARKPRAFEDRYEPRIFLRGELQVRPEHPHDTFNVLCWLAFPQAKAALNARHYDALRRQAAAGIPNRGPGQDALTLFDESGVVMASADADLLQLVRDFRWKALFWSNRLRLMARARCFLFGHALYEKMLRPFRGITGRAILLDVAPAFLAAPLREQLSVVDERVAGILSDAASLAATRELAVLPVLGVPGWHPDNEAEAFYDDTDYFRPGRAGSRES